MSTPHDQPEIQQTYTRFQGDLQSLASKIGELEQEAEEHSYVVVNSSDCHAYSVFIFRLVLTTLDEALAEEPDRKCFRLVGGVLVERTVKDVVPALQTNRDGVHLCYHVCFSLCMLTMHVQIKKVIAGLTEQYKNKEEEFDTFKQEYNIRPTNV